MPNLPNGYAVCPTDEYLLTRTPELFLSKSAATRFLNTEIPPGPIELEAEVTGLTIEQVQARRAERRAQLLKDRKEATEKMKRGELHPLCYPPRLVPIRNRDAGWQDFVPVRRLDDWSGAANTCRLSDTFGKLDNFHLRVGSDTGREWIVDMCDRVIASHVNIGSGPSLDITCYLDYDWGFDDNAWTLCNYGGKHNSFVSMIYCAVAALEMDLNTSHPSCPRLAVADFWGSWQVRRHIARCCVRIVNSQAARALISDDSERSEQVEYARLLIHRYLASFVYRVRSDLRWKEHVT